MKRHQSLIALSHDHHHGLLLAQLIKKKSPYYKGLPTDTASKVKRVKESWEKELKLHFENEENILFPFVKGRDEELDNLINEILQEHVTIKLLVEGLDTTENILAALDQLGNTLERHIRKEERQLFQKIQNLFADELDSLENKIEPVKKSCKI